MTDRLSDLLIESRGYRKPIEQHNGWRSSPAEASRRARRPIRSESMSGAASLYRRHRPRTFDDVIGQEHVVRTLRNAVDQGNVHHAYLFVGSRGTGKTSMAKILASA